MTKVFEDYFSELQADMVSICLEYVNNKADMIYIYASNECGQFSTDVFYQINKVIVKKHKVNENLREIGDLCKKNNREMPTEMKVIYDGSENKLNAQYSYEIKYTNDPEKLPSHIFNDWFEEMGGKI
ncbi:DUF600 domain-containing protein [Brevibacillus porteri]|uniref:DUF600 domain-containing protein n=1 Tax=Brevibacillus porteri TaxID=2126350 RepID=UPI003D209C75